MLFTAPLALAYEPTTELGGVAGLSDLQQRTGDAVQTVCINFINNGVDQNRNDTVQQGQLFDKCGEMVHTARVLAGEDDDTARTNKSLGISAGQLGSALQNVSAEEIAAAGSLATESSTHQSNIVGNRLASVLSRVSTLQLSSLSLDGSWGLASAEQLLTGTHSGGGAASDDAGATNGLGFYFSGTGASTRKIASEAEDAFDSDAAGFSIGLDKQFNSGLVGGINFSFANSDVDFKSSDSVAGGELESDQTNLSIYGLWFGESTYVDLVAGVGTGSYDMKRRIVINSAPGAFDEQDPANPQPNDGANDTVSASTDSSVYQLSASGGLELRSGALSFAPYTRLSYLSVELDAYEETGESALKMRVDSQTIDSFTAGFGFRIAGTFSGSKAIISPQFSLEMVHEFMDDSRKIISRYVHDPGDTPLTIVTDAPDRTYYSTGFGVSAVLPSGTQLYSEVRSLMDLDTINDIAFTAGVRFAF